MNSSAQLSVSRAEFVRNEWRLVTDSDELHLWAELCLLSCFL